MADRNMRMTKGDTLAFGIVIENADVELETAYFSCKANPNYSAYVFQKSLGDGITKVDDGQYTVRVAPENTANVDAGKYYYDLQIGANGDIFTVLKGCLYIEEGIT